MAKRQREGGLERTNGRNRQGADALGLNCSEGAQPPCRCPWNRQGT